MRREKRGTFIKKLKGAPLRGAGFQRFNEKKVLKIDRPKAGGFLGLTAALPPRVAVSPLRSDEFCNSASQNGKPYNWACARGNAPLLPPAVASSPKGKHVTGFSDRCASLQHGYHRLTGVTPVPLPTFRWKYRRRPGCEGFLQTGTPFISKGRLPEPSRPKAVSNFRTLRTFGP